MSVLAQLEKARRMFDKSDRSLETSFVSTFITTRDLIEKLQKAGLNVNRNQLYLDIQGEYFQPRQVERLGCGKLVGRTWEPWEVRRAFYLYRLRKRKVEGKLLRVFLFLRDGRGWEEVQPICLDGLIKLIEHNKIPVRKQIKKPEPKSIESTLDDILAGIKPKHRPKKRTALFIWGLGFFGRPLKRGSLKLLAYAVGKLILGRKPEPRNPIVEQFEVAQQLIAASGLDWKDIIGLIKNADSRQADLARRRFIGFLKEFRGWLHAEHNRLGLKRQSSNLLTWGGRSTAELGEVFREQSVRLTPAQLLAGVMGITLVIDEMFKPDLLLELLMNLIRLS
jgi:hypothetical protein